VPEQERTPNLQWNWHKGDILLREAITEAGLKLGNPRNNEGWQCYITNAVKQPDRVKERNSKKKDQSYWQDEAKAWRHVLQIQIDNGSPKVLVALGKEVYKILEFMIADGLKAPHDLQKVDHYSYVMFRPEARTHRGPGNRERIAEFKQNIISVAKQYCS